MDGRNATAFVVSEQPHRNTRRFPDDPGAAETVYGSGNCKNEVSHKLLRDDGALVFDGRGAT